MRASGYLKSAATYKAIGLRLVTSQMVEIDFTGCSKSSAGQKQSSGHELHIEDIDGGGAGSGGDGGRQIRLLV